MEKMKAPKPGGSHHETPPDPATHANEIGAKPNEPTKKRGFAWTD